MPFTTTASVVIVVTGTVENAAEAQALIAEVQRHFPNTAAAVTQDAVQPDRLTVAEVLTLEDGDRVQILASNRPSNVGLVCTVTYDDFGSDDNIVTLRKPNGSRIAFDEDDVLAGKLGRAA